MSDVLPQIILVLALVLVNAAFAGTELALVSLREGQLRRLESRSATGAVLARLARQPNEFFATIQIGITLAGFLAAAFAAVSLAEPLEEPLASLGDAARPVSIVVVTLVLSYITLVFGELAPKRLAMQRAERWGLVMARPLSALSTATRPVVWLLSRSTDIVVRLLGGDPDQQREDVTEAELREIVATQDMFTGQQRLIIDGAFEIAERTLREVLVPRRDVFVIDPDWTCAEALEHLAESGHTRAPVAPERNLDQVCGVVHLRQLLAGRDTPVSMTMVEVPVFPDAAAVLTTMRQLQLRRAQMAVVFNERGSAAGIVTMEDLVEELVGEIYDETDPDLVTVRHESDGTHVLPGRFPVHDLSAVAIDLPEGKYATIAGLVLHELGHIPEVGDTLTLNGWMIEVRGVEGWAITEVALSPDPSRQRPPNGDFLP